MKFMSGDLYGGSERCCDRLRRQRAAAMTRAARPAAAAAAQRERITDPSQTHDTYSNPLFSYVTRVHPRINVKNLLRLFTQERK